VITEDRRAVEARLIYNSGAGRANGLAVETLRPIFAQSGIAVRYDLTETEQDLDAALAEPGELVVVMGGDGTVRAVVTRLRGRQVPISIIPTGTANNIALALGILGRAPQEIVAGLAQPRRRVMDLGVARGPWGQQYVVESAGCGLFADLLYAYAPENGRSLVRALTAAAHVLPGYHGTAAHITVDGRDLTGTFLFAEVLNCPYIAMRVPLAPAADISDGELDVVLIEDAGRAGLLTYLGAALLGRADALPNATVVRGQKIRMTWEASAAHVDDALSVPPPGSPDADRSWLEVEVLPAAQEVWIPAMA
jgi:diacylglycerol kinase family enzyme